MFTVIVAKKEFIDSINEYSLFLKPFLDKSKVSFCEWIPSEKAPADSVPTLEHTVKNTEKWRLIVVDDELDTAKKNPFDAVGYEEPVLEPMSSFDESFEDANPDEEDLFYRKQKDHLNQAYSEYLKTFRPAKHAAYEAAANKPLTRLMAFLNEKPYDPGEDELIADSPLYEEYLADTRKKSELRDSIVGNRELRISYPSEIICIATRVDYDISYDIRTAWDMPDDSKYSRFYDWNMYYDKMRYLIFDISTETHQKYVTDYIRLLCATLILADNDTPSSVLKPNRVYSLICEKDEEELSRFFAKYDKKLSATKEQIARKLDKLQHTVPESLSDSEVKSEFCRGVSVNVPLFDKFDSRGMLADKKKVGLSSDCPRDEYHAWGERFHRSKKDLADLLKLPKRALKKATDDFRYLNTLESDRVQYLNEFQIEDVEEFVSKEQLRMVGTKTDNISDTDHYYRRMDKSDRLIKDKIETRMTKKTTVFLALAAIAAFLIGFIPLFTKHSVSVKTVIGALALAIAGVALFAAVAFVSLFFLRSSLVGLVKRFNSVVRGIITSIVGSSERFSKYLSHACNVMRGYSVLNYRESNEPEHVKAIHIMRKHLTDIDRAREEMLETFGSISETTAAETVPEEDPYPYDFSRPVDYRYPLPFSEGDKRKIDFLLPGNKIEVPIAFINGISVVREELYDHE